MFYFIFSFKSYLLNIVWQSGNRSFCSLFFGAPVCTSLRILVAALILPWHYSPSTKTCTEPRPFIHIPDKASNRHESKPLTGQLRFHSFPTLISVSAAAPLLWRESLPLEYLLAAHFWCIFRAYDSIKTQNYLCWLWINLISNHLKQKTGREFYWKKVLVFVWQKRWYRGYETCFHNSLRVSALTMGVTMIQVAQGHYSHLNRVIHQQKNWWCLISLEFLSSFLFQWSSQVCLKSPWHPRVLYHDSFVAVDSYWAEYLMSAFLPCLWFRSFSFQLLIFMYFLGV